MGGNSTNENYIPQIENQQNLQPNKQSPQNQQNQQNFQQNQQISIENILNNFNPEIVPSSKRILSKEEEIELDRQYTNLKKSKVIPIVNCSFIDNDKTHWKVVFLGTEGTPYENGYFQVELIFKDVFPKNGPEAKFITKMFHPNIGKNGHVCMDLLNCWNEKTTMENVFYGIIEILDNPVPENGYANDAKKLLEEDYDKYMDTVEEYTIKYAMEGF